MHGYDRYNTTILSIIHKMSTKCFDMFCIIDNIVVL